MADSLRARLEIYTPAQLAAKLGISRRSVRAAIQSGKLEAKKVNARVHLIESYQAAKWWVSL